MSKDVTAKVTKSAGTDVPADVTPSNDKRTRKAIEPSERTLIVRGAKRRYWEILVAALDGSTDAIATLFGNVPPAAPVRPVLSDDDRSDNAKVMAHIEALETYSSDVETFASRLDAFATANVATMNLRNAINAALLDIPLRKRSSDEDEANEQDARDEEMAARAEQPA